MTKKDKLLTFVHDEINPIFNKAIENASEEQKQELLQMFDFEKRQKAFRKGLAAFQHLYPSVLDPNEQKRLAEEMALMQKNFKTEPLKTSSYILAAMWSVANTAAQKKDYKNALAIYETILSLDSKLDGIWVSYGQCLKEAGHPEKATTAFKTAYALLLD